MVYLCICTIHTKGNWILVAVVRCGYSGRECVPERHRNWHSIIKIPSQTTINNWRRFRFHEQEFEWSDVENLLTTNIDVFISFKWLWRRVRMQWLMMIFQIYEYTSIQPLIWSTMHCHGNFVALWHQLAHKKTSTKQWTKSMINSSLSYIICLI